MASTPPEESREKLLKKEAQRQASAVASTIECVTVIASSGATARALRLLLYELLVLQPQLGTAASEGSTSSSSSDRGAYISSSNSNTSGNGLSSASGSSTVNWSSDYPSTFGPDMDTLVAFGLLTERAEFEALMERAEFELLVAAVCSALEPKLPSFSSGQLVQLLDLLGKLGVSTQTFLKVS